VWVPAGLLATLALFGAFQFAAPFAILPLAQQHITSSMAGIANAMTPVATVLISHAWPGGERVNLRKLSGVAFGVAGIVVLATRGGGHGDAEAEYVFFALGAPACYGIALNLARRFAGLDPVVVTAWAMTGGLILIAPFALGIEGTPALPDVPTLAALVVIGVGLTSATFIAMYSILPVVGATNLSLVTLVAPLSATLIGVVAFGDALSAEHFGGMGLILAGLLTIDGRLIRARTRSQPRAIRTATMATYNPENLS
jgi:drug/metabolite transporter (DMT)-like permease